jgi:ATP-dependent DNA ligase
MTQGRPGPRRQDQFLHPFTHEPVRTSPVKPPIEPMLARLAEALPPEGDFLYEPKWDGFRALVFRSERDLHIQSRDLKPLDRYFPELHDALLERLPLPCVLDGEIVIAGPSGLDFDALQMRLHPAASRVEKLARETPASFIAFDVLSIEGEDLVSLSQAQRRNRLEQLLSNAKPPLHLTPMTRERALALDWLQRFEGAGLDGVVAKPAALAYQPGKRALIKVKHVRTAECVVVGFRRHKASDDAIGSLLLGLYDARGVLHHAGVTSAFTMARRRELLKELGPLRTDERHAGAPSRWNAGKDASWEALRPERVCEVKYDHLQGDRFRHATIFLRWRPDKRPEDCRYDQLEVTPPFELARIL